MDRVNKDSLGGEVVHFATKHGKEKILAPLLAGLGMRCLRVDIDTDQFGTFSGEIARPGNVRETLRLKISEAIKICPQERFFLASEGSFGPHPFLSLLPSDHEALLLYDRILEHEIYVEELSTLTNHSALQVSCDHDNFEQFVTSVGFPTHGIIVTSDKNKSIVFKDIRNKSDLKKAIIDALYLSDKNTITLKTDMRSCYNPTRRKIIYQSGMKLIKALRSRCPECNIYGYTITKGLPGLPCESCGSESKIAKHVVWSCAKCNFSQIRERPDRMKKISMSECDYCNP